MLPQPYRKPVVAEEPRSRWRKAKWLLLLLIPIFGWQAWRMIASGRALNKAIELQAKLDDRTLSDEQRQQLFRDLRGTMANLSSSQRQVLFAEQQKRQEKELDHYFAMSKAEQKKYLDDRINRMQQGMAKQNGARPAGTANAKAGSPGGNVSASFGAGGGKGFGGKGGSPDEIESRKKKMLDNTSADLRAKNDRFRREMDQRMKERGIAPPQGRR